MPKSEYEPEFQKIIDQITTHHRRLKALPPYYPHHLVNVSDPRQILRLRRRIGQIAMKAQNDFQVGAVADLGRACNISTPELSRLIEYARYFSDAEFRQHCREKRTFGALVEEITRRSKKATAKERQRKKKEKAEELRRKKKPKPKLSKAEQRGKKEAQRKWASIRRQWKRADDEDLLPPRL